jgi:hypothetical protein
VLDHDYHEQAPSTFGARNHGTMEHSSAPIAARAHSIRATLRLAGIAGLE